MIIHQAAPCLRRPRLQAAAVFFFIVLTGITAASARQVSPSVNPHTAAEFVPGQLVVTVAGGFSRSAVVEAVRAAGGEVVRFSRVAPDRFVVKVPAGKEDEFLRRYRRMPGVRIIEKNYIYRACWKPNDPLYQHQWHFNKPNFIYAETGWDISRGAENVVVAVVDTGVAYENYAVPDYERGEVVGNSYVQAPDLAGTKFVPGYDFVHDDAHPNDQNGHGTHVAGTIAQTTDNAAHVAGLAHLCAVMPIQVLDYAGSGDLASIADGLDFARQHGAHVVNMSFGASMWTETLKKACDEANAAGLVLVAAAGNDGQGNLSYPAAYNSVISVAAVDYNGARTFYSNYGLGLDVCAPGGDTTVDQNGDGNPDGVYQMTYKEIYDPGPPERLTNVMTFEDQWFMGTSMATPHVAALAALIIATGVKNNVDVRKKIIGSATDLGTAGYDLEYGYGLINCEKSLQPGVPDIGECGDCGSMAPFTAAIFYGGFFFSYGVIFVRRRFRR